MNGEQLVDDLISLLRRHETTFRGASLNQEPYKGDFFRIFAQAFNAGLINRNPEPTPYLRADAIRDIIARTAPDVIDTQTFYTIHDFWHEWTYAWEHADLLQDDRRN